MNPGRQEALNRKWFEWYKEEAEWDTAGQGTVNQGRKKAVKRGFAGSSTLVRSLNFALHLAEFMKLRINKIALISLNGHYEKLSRVISKCSFSIAFTQMISKVRMSKWSISHRRKAPAQRDLFCILQICQVPLQKAAFYLLNIKTITAQLHRKFSF